MENLIQYSPLFQLVFVFVLIPIWKLAKSSMTSREEVDELKKLNRNITQEIRILKLVVFQYLPDEAIKTYLKEQMKNDESYKSN